MSERGGAYIHMTRTEGGETLRNIRVVCRCGWTHPDSFATMRDAYAAGDAHLAEENGAEEVPYCGFCDGAHLPRDCPSIAKIKDRL